jgi:O-antigen/teichoic acid export membrane protein
MTLTKKIATNVFWQILGKGVATILGVITIGLLTRYLGQSGFGYYSTALAFMQFFGVLVDFGLYLVCLKEIATTPDKEEKIIANVLTIRLISAFFFLAGGVILLYCLPYPMIVKQAALVVSFSFFLMSLVQILTSVFQTRLKMGYVALAEALGRLFFLGLIWLFINKQAGLSMIMVGNIANAFVYFIVLWLFARRWLKLHLAWDWSYQKRIFTLSWPIALGIVFNLVYFRADTIILSWYHSASVVGLYSAPYKILEIITTFPHMFMGLVMSFLASSVVLKNFTRTSEILQKVFDFFIMISLAMVFLMTPVATKIMTLIAGQDFAVSGQILPLLLIATAIIFLGTPFTYAIVVLEKQKTMLKYFAMAAVLALIGYFIFIPRYSYWGAAWVTVVVELFISLSAGILTYRFSGFVPRLKVFAKSLISAIIGFAVCWLLKDLYVLWSLVISFAVYSLCLILFKAISRETLQELLSLKTKPPVL